MDLVQPTSQRGHHCFASLNISLVNSSLLLLNSMAPKIPLVLSQSLPGGNLHPLIWSILRGEARGRGLFSLLQDNPFHILRQLLYLPLEISGIFSGPPTIAYKGIVR